MPSRKLKLNKKKKHRMLADNPLQIRDLGVFSNFKLNESVKSLPTKIRNLGIVLDESLILKNQITTETPLIIRPRISKERVTPKIIELNDLLFRARL